MTNATSEPMELEDLPGLPDVGRSRHWEMPLDAFEDGKTLAFDGRFLGIGSSHRDTHIGHVDSDHAVSGVRCSACRWFESRLFRAGNRYILHRTGESMVPGEDPFYSYEEAVSAYEVLELLTTRKTNSDGSKRSFLAFPAARLLAQAAGNDEGMRTAYEGRMTNL